MTDVSSDSDCVDHNGFSPASRLNGSNRTIIGVPIPKYDGWMDGWMDGPIDRLDHGQECR
eukprot:scaffold1323_cov160-Amphora_coffeaeformis.AAC.4